jgi:uncharacterized protein YeaO (DUF488 family)
VGADAVLQVKVWLVGISPMVWRRILVPARFTLRELHGVIQVAMGWEGIHLYVFRLRAARYGSWELSPSPKLVSMARSAETEGEWEAFVRAFRAEMNQPAASRTLDLLAALSHSADFSVGCYCEDEARCHRSVLKALLAGRGAAIA